MKQGGLDTLAALCGGASKAHTSISKTNTALAMRHATAKASNPSPGLTPKPAAPVIVQRSVAPAVQPVSAPIHATQQSPPTMNPSVQQWQAIATAYGGGSVPNSSAATAAVASILQGVTQNHGSPNFPQSSTDSNTVNAMQQVAYYQYLAAAQAQAQAQVQAHFAAGQQQQQAGNSTTGQPGQGQNGQPTFTMDPNAAAAFTFTGHPASTHFQMASDAGKRMHTPQQQVQQQPQIQHQQQQQQHSQPSHSNMQVIPGPLPTGATPKPVSTAAPSSMQPPPPPSQNPPTPSALSTNAFSSDREARPIAPTSSGTIMQMTAPPTAIAQRPSLENSSVVTTSSSEESCGGGGNKKQQKRAANRRSAQLSRKRKKLFIEELKEENDELRRKEQILKSIPDLIVVFDSAGKLWFVSHSVGRFLDFMPEELEGSSFWDRLCDESVRLLKAAFMDALAARQHDMDTAPLGSGVWELRLVDKDGTHKVITLNGVVHFSGDAPECVCSIRPRDDKTTPTGPGQVTTISRAMASAQSGVCISTPIRPQQSVISGSGGVHYQADDALVRLAHVKAQVNLPVIGSTGRRAAQISDGDSGGSVVSESGSEELLS